MAEFSHLRAPIACATGTACLFGLAEWTRAGLGGNLQQADATRALAALLFAYCSLGLLAGLIAWATRRQQDRLQAAAIALPPALCLSIACVFRPGQLTPLLLLAAVALGWTGFRLVSWLLARAPALLSPMLWWGAAACTASATLALSARNAPDTTGATIAVLAATIALGAGITLSMSGRSKLFAGARGPMITVAIVFLSSALLGLRFPPVEPDVAPAGRRTSVLLVTMDTLRADRVGAYGHAAARTPTMDRLAAEGSLFRTAVTQSVFTGPSHTSILTGLLPRSHGVLYNLARVAHSVPTLADLLRAEGYVTGAFVSGMTTIDSSTALPSRFHEFDDRLDDFRALPMRIYGTVLYRAVKTVLERWGFESAPAYRQATETADPAVKWLERNREASFFAWVHFFDPHLPYQPPAPFIRERSRPYAGPVDGRWYDIRAGQRAEIASSPENVERMLELYDAEIAYADSELARVVDAARRAAGANGLVIVVTSDHGESMGEHDLYWYRDLYDPTLRVPLIVVAPDGGGDLRREVTEQARLIDVAPTILDLVGIESEVAVDGRSLVPLMHAAEAAAMTPPAYSAIYRGPRSLARERFSVRTSSWKLIEGTPGWIVRGEMLRAEPTWELFDLEKDPSEANNLFPIPADIVENLRAELRANVLEPGPATQVLTPEERARLRALGYIR